MRPQFWSHQFEFLFSRPFWHLCYVVDKFIIHLNIYFLFTVHSGDILWRQDNMSYRGPFLWWHCRRAVQWTSPNALGFSGEPVTTVYWWNSEDTSASHRRSQGMLVIWVDRAFKFLPIAEKSPNNSKPTLTALSLWIVIAHNKVKLCPGSCNCFKVRVLSVVMCKIS